MNTKIGIDIGRVIIGGDTDQTARIFFTDHFLEAKSVENAFQYVHLIVEKFGKQNTFLVSKCGVRTEERTLAWLSHHHFFEKTGVVPDKVHFCRERKDKRKLCQRFGIDIFIDDRYSVLRHLTNLQQLFLFNPLNEELLSFQKDKPAHCHLVYSWQEVYSQLIHSYEITL